MQFLGCMLKAKASDSYIVRFTGTKHDQLRFTMIGSGSWSARANGAAALMRPSIEHINEQVDLWQQLANTPPPQSTTSGLHQVSIHQHNSENPSISMETFINIQLMTKYTASLYASDSSQRMSARKCFPQIQWTNCTIFKNCQKFPRRSLLITLNKMAALELNSVYILSAFSSYNNICITFQTGRKVTIGILHTVCREQLIFICDAGSLGNVRDAVVLRMTCFLSADDFSCLQHATNMYELLQNIINILWLQ